MSDRLSRLRAAMAERGVDAAIVSHPANRAYLSGFFSDDHGPDEPGAMLLVEPNRARLLTSIVNLPWAAASVRGEVEAVDWGTPWPRRLGETLKESGVRRVGIEENALTVGALDGILEGLDGAAEIERLGAAVDRLRAVKDADELALIEEAIRITDEAFVAATTNLAAGTTERELADRLDRTMRDLGASGPGFDTIVAAGPHAARPHHDPTDRPIEEGEPVIIDMGARYRGYNADLTRTIWVGEATERLRTIYTIVFDANAAARAGLRAGLTGAEADRLAREPIEAAGFGEQFTHSLGHGLGIKVHEAPSLRKTSDEALEPGNVVTIEPGIYLPEWGGVRIEDVGVIAPDGVRVLTGAPKFPRP